MTALLEQFPKDANFSPFVAEFTSPAEPRVTSKWKVVREIGVGGYGSVYEVKSNTGLSAAKKVIFNTAADKRVGMLKGLNEVNAMKVLKHPHIVELYEANVHPTTGEVHLYMELARGGDLLDYLHQNGSLSEDQARLIFLQLLSAVDSTHRRGYVHRDIKAENVFLDQNMNAKLGDWGFAARWAPGRKLKEFCGSLHYSAPEICSGSEYSGPEVDVWSLGVLLYAMCAGKLPFRGKTDWAVFNQIKECTYEMPATFSPHLSHLLSRILVKEPLRRATLMDIKLHPWIKSGSPSTVKTPAKQLPKSTSMRSLKCTC